MTDDPASRERWGAAGWRRWEPGLAQLSWPLAFRMAAVAEVGPGQRVLDVGCGIGDPTLQVAVLAGPHGRVVGIDLAEPMLAIARERAAALGLTHVEFLAGDVATMALPGPFDVVLGRWSVNYLHDVVGTLGRLRDALVSGGRIAVAAWAPPDANPWMAVPLAAFAEVGAPIDTDPQRPGMFQCSEDGVLARALLRAGFQSVDQERVRLSFFAHDPDDFWTMLLRDETGGPFAAALDALDAVRAEAVGRRVRDGIARYGSGGVLRIPAQAQLAWARA